MIITIILTEYNGYAPLILLLLLANVLSDTLATPI